MITRTEESYGVVYRLHDKQRHRTNGCGIVWDDGTWDWYLFDRWHRYYGPQSEKGEWFLHGEFIKQ